LICWPSLLESFRIMHLTIECSIYWGPDLMPLIFTILKIVGHIVPLTYKLKFIENRIWYHCLIGILKMMGHIFPLTYNLKFIEDQI
jgi:hypothetical protein